MTAELPFFLILRLNGNQAKKKQEIEMFEKLSLKIMHGSLKTWDSVVILIKANWKLLRELVLTLASQTQTSHFTFPTKSKTLSFVEIYFEC